MALTGKVVVALEWSNLSLSLCLVILRLYLRRRILNRFTFSDLFVLLAWISFLMQTSMDTALYKLGYFEGRISASATEFGPEHGLASYDDTVSALKIVYVETCLYYTTFYFVKWSMLAFYETLIPRNMRALRAALWITVGLTVVGWVSSLFVKMFVCEPMMANWTPGKQFCDPMTGTIGNAVRWSQHVFTDILVYVLPLFLLRRLRLATKQKIGVALTFVIGFTCIAFACMEQIAIETNCRGVVIWLYSDFEQTWAMVVVCCPAFRAFFKSWGDNNSTGDGNRISRSIKRMFPGSSSGSSPGSRYGHSQVLSGSGKMLRSPEAAKMIGSAGSNSNGSGKRGADITDFDLEERGGHRRNGSGSCDSLVGVYEDEKRQIRRLSNGITVTYEIRSNTTDEPKLAKTPADPKVTTIAWSSSGN